jgi:hypothetical protein
MQMEKTLAEFGSVPLPPACPNCWQVMSLTTAEPWTLLRGNQLTKYVFECNNCGYTTARMMQED